MGKAEKKLNKRIVGAIIGSTIVGLGGLSMTSKGKSFRQRMSDKTKRRSGYLIEGRTETLKRFKK